VLNLQYKLYFLYRSWW